VIGYGADMGECKGRGFERGKSIPRDNTGSLQLAGSRTENPRGLQGDKSPKTEGGILSSNLLVYRLLSDQPIVLKRIASDKVRVCMANGLDACGVTQFVVKINQDNVEPIKDIINLAVKRKDVARSDMGDPDT